MTDPRRPFHRYPNRYFVETGTEEGQGVMAALNAGFEQVVSFELFESSYIACAAKFRDYSNVRIVNGDSGMVLYDNIKHIDGRATVWLDGHYTGPGSGFGCRGAPLLEELDQIRKHPLGSQFTILIDDRRMLQIKGNGGLDTYFELTEDDVRKKLLQINPNYIIEYADGCLPGDILVARPPPPPSSATNDDVKGFERPPTATKGHISPPPHDDGPRLNGLTKAATTDERSRSTIPFAAYPNRVFVESGGGLGNNVMAALKAGVFGRIISIEPDAAKYQTMADNVGSTANVRILQADTGLILGNEIEPINEPITFFLNDGRYSTVLDELEWIRRHRIRTHTILIGRRNRSGNVDITEDDIRKKLLEINPSYTIEYTDGDEPNGRIVAVPPTFNAVPIVQTTTVVPEATVADNIPFIDRIVYINLTRRTDRRTEIEAEFRRVGLPPSKIVRFDAIEHIVGCYGATLSHIAVLEAALKRNDETTLVLEDDFNFAGDVGWLLRQLRQFFQRHAGTYDVAMLTACAGPTTIKVPVDEIVSRVTAGASGCGYIVRRGYLPTLIDNLKDGAPHLLRTFDHWNFALDRYWRVLQQYDRWFLFDPALGGQRDSACDTNVKTIIGQTAATINDGKQESTALATTALTDQEKSELWYEQMPASTSAAFDILTGLVKPLPETTSVPLPAGFGPDFAGLNPTLLKMAGLPIGAPQAYVCIVRHINWINGGLRPRKPNDNTLVNRNLVLILKADDLTEIGRAELIEESSRKRSATTGWTGFEDCRLFSATAGRLEFLCTIFDQDGTDKPQMARVVANFDNVRKLWIAADVRPLKRLAAAGEKNWLAVDRLQLLPSTVWPKADDDSVTAIYHWHPFLLLQLTGSTAIPVAFANPTRGRLSEGSAAPVAFPRSDGMAGYLALVHESHHNSAGIGRFYHRFVWMDPQFTIVARSLLFCFRQAGTTEYCCGMVVSHDGCRILFGVGSNDAAAAVMSVDRRIVDGLLKPVDRLVPLQAVSAPPTR